MSNRLPSDFKEITDPQTCLEGVFAELVTPNDLTKWRVYITAPSGTPFEGGVFETEISFPAEYPMAPPELIFVSEMWHPNVYPDGKVCISILHPPGKDQYNEMERAEERWMPAHSPLSIFNCFLTLFEEPNIFSPANIDASTMWRDRRDEFNNRAKEIVTNALKNLPEGLLAKLPKPDTDPLQRARRIKDKLDILNTNDPFYNKRKAQLEKVIWNVLQGLDPNEHNIEGIYRHLCPKDEDDIDDDGDGDGLAIQCDWSDDNDDGDGGDEIEIEMEDDEVGEEDKSKK